MERSLALCGERYCRKESLVRVINTGLAAALSSSLTFAEIKAALIRMYNAA